MNDYRSVLVPAERLSMDEAGAMLGLNHMTVRGWARHGLKRRDGTVVKLKTTRLGWRVYTTRTDLTQFLGAMNAEPVAEPQPALAGV